MVSLPALLGFLISTLESNPICKLVEIIETNIFSSDQFFFKIRAKLTEKINLQTRIYFNKGHFDYAYQVFSEIPLFRWDNKEEFSYLESYPHHFHDDLGNIKDSPLQGDPVKDIEYILQEISAFLKKSNRQTD